MTDIATMARGTIAAGFDGLEYDPSLPRFGAYVLFARNVASLQQVRALTDALRARANGDGAEPLIAIDQEGGRVVRLREGVEAMPSAMALGATGDLELARRAGERVAFDSRRAGCTLDFAPVLDLARYPANTVIGTRSFGSDPQGVAAIGAAFVEGVQGGGVAACCKHFPGHGATPDDSHVALPAIEDDAPALLARDVAPFAALAPHCAAIMGTHGVVRAFDDLPATLSKRVITDLLRGALGFAGAYVTDCLQMSALAAWGVPGAGVAALNAGADLLIVSHDPALAGETAERIERAVADGTLSLDRLREAYARVLRLRGNARPPIALDAEAPHPGIGREIGRRAITLVRGEARMDATATAVISFEGAVGEGIETAPAAAASLRRELPSLHEMRAPLDPGDDAAGALLEALTQTRRRPLLLARRAHLHPGQARAIARIVAAHPDAVVASLLEPWDVTLFAGTRHVVAAYGDDAPSLGGLADVLFDGRRAEGRLPVEFPS